MRFLFREGDTRSAKFVKLAFTVLLFFALIGLSNRTNIVPNAAWTPWCDVVGILVGVAGFWAASKDKNPKSKYNQYSPFKRFIALAFIFCISATMGYFCMSHSVPTIFSKFVLTPLTQEASVAYVWNERTGRGCSFRIDIAGGPLPKSVSPCVSKEIWSSSRAGDSVYVSFTDSFMAFVIEDIHLTN